MFVTIFRCCVLWFSVYTFRTIAEDSSKGLCLPAADCTECLIQGPQCTWCMQMEYSTSQRCDTVEGHDTRGCHALSVINPISRTIYKQNSSVRNADLNLSIPAIQISPQKLELKLSPGRSVKVPITFRIAEDYPVDLYYIMDMSYSMVDDQANLIKLGEDLENELKKISKDVRLGFGAFVDKPIMPYIGTRPRSIENPCYPRAECGPAYGYINQLSLTSNTSIFGEKVRATPISANQDGPEGGLDALLQAMVCTKKIGWRKDSRKIILYSTDAKSHIAGDGKVGGITEPNDGHCHLKQNKYTYSTKQDYPSISQIADISRNTSTSIIFAVAAFEDEYRLISRLINNSAVGPLANDSSNIVSLVREQYNSLIKTVDFGTIGVPDGIKVVFRTNCSSLNGEMVDSNVCDSAHIGQYIHFEAEISMDSCSKGGSYSFDIKPQDLSDSITINLEIRCECDCGDEEEHSSRCSGVGTFRCGVCECDSGYGGDNCECESSADESSDSCINPLSGEVCSARGECNSCGKCQCDCLLGELEPSCDRYTGQFCECNTKSCPQKNGVICSGNGDCVCNELSSNSYCKCTSGYLGQDCSCPVSDFNCRPENGTGAVCNGKGDCVCGTCTCTDACYSGPTCSILTPECSRTCVSFKECVVCKVRLLEATSTCSSNSPCSTHNIQMVSRLNLEGGCFYEDINGCRHHYRYDYSHKNTSWTITILNQPKCQKDYWLEVIIGVCVGVLLLGVLALIIWKRIVTLHDSREFAKFEKEAQQARWKSTNNPIYKPATSTFRNPMYHKSAPENADDDDHPHEL